MARLPMVPENWLAGDQAPEMKNLPTRNDDGPVTLTDMLYGEPQPLQSTALSWFIEPHEIATIPGLPDYAYAGGQEGALGSYADQRVQQDVNGANDLSGIGSLPQLPASAPPSRAAAGQPGGYVSRLDQVSLAPLDGGLTSPNLPDLPGQTPSESENFDKLRAAGKGAGFLGHGIDLWNAQNAAAGISLGQEGARVLRKYTEPVAKVLGPIETGLEAYSELKKGAPLASVLTGAGAKTVTGWAGAGIGTLGGAEFAGAVGGPEIAPAGGLIGGAIGGFAPDFAYRHMSQEQIGRALLKLPGIAADSYPTYVYNNPYYDPRTAMP